MHGNTMSIWVPTLQFSTPATNIMAAANAAMSPRRNAIHSLGWLYARFHESSALDESVDDSRT
jgi:hypothetical protein